MGRGLLRSFTLGIFALALAVVLVTPAAFAQDDVEARREEAKKLADTAYDLMQKGQYPEAISAFRKADQTFHSPVFRVYIADCLDKLGKLAAARDALQGVIDEKLAEYAPDSFRRAQNDARERMAALEKRVPVVTFTLRGSGTVELDGKRVSLRKPIFADPGAHKAVAIADDGRRDEKSFTLVEGDRTDIALTIPAVGSPTTPVPEPDPTPDDAGRSYVPAAVAFGVAGAGVLLGAIVGGVFVSRADALKEACANDADGDALTCPDGAEIDSVKVLGNVATAGWVIAGVGAVAGVVLLFVPIGDDENASLRISPTGAAVHARF